MAISAMMFLAIALALTEVSAQSFDPRDRSRASDHYVVKDASGAIVERGAVVMQRRVGFAQATWNVFGGTQLTADLPFHRIGSVQRVAPDIFLASGRTVGQSQEDGVLCLLRLIRTPTLQLSVTDTRTYAGVDFCYSAWNSVDGFIYALDWATKAVLIGPWTGVGQPFPSSFIPVLTGNAVPYSSAPSWDAMKVDEGISGFRMKGPDFAPYTWVRPEASQWTITSDPPQNIAATPEWSVSYPYWTPTGALALQQDSQVLIGPKSFLLAGPVGVVQLLDESGAPVASYDLANHWQYQQFDIPSVANTFPGLPYTLKKLGSSVRDVTFRPTVRFGLPAASDGIGVSKGMTWSKSCFVGAADYRVTVDHFVTPDAASARNLPVHLWVGFRNADGQDPVDLAGDVAVLRPSLVITGNLRIPAGFDIGTSSIPFPISDDASLEGVVLLFQLVMPTENGVGYSDVFGTTILPAQAMALSTAGAQEETLEASVFVKGDKKARKDILSNAKSGLFMAAKKKGLKVEADVLVSPQYHFLRGEILRSALNK